MKAKPADNRVAPPSWLRRYGCQLGIIGVGLAMWLSFVFAAPAVFTNIDIYKAFAQTTPQFGIIALALTFVVITGEIDLSFPSIMALGTASFCLARARLACPGPSALDGAFVVGRHLRLDQRARWWHGSTYPSLVITIGTSFLFRGLELVLMNGTGVPLTADQYPALHAMFREPVFGVPVQTLWMIGVAVVLWAAAQPHALRRACLSGRRQSDQRPPDGRQTS